MSLRQKMGIGKTRVNITGVSFDDIEERKVQLQFDIKEIEENIKKIDNTREMLNTQKLSMQGALAMCEEFLNVGSSENEEQKRIGK